MEQHREIPKMMVIFLLTIVNIPASSYSQNLYAFTFDVNPTKSDRLVDRVWSQPLNTTTSVSRENTTDLPSSTSTRSKEILDSSETNALGRYAQPSYRHEEYTGNDDEDDNDDDDSSEESPDHAIPYSGHEETRDVPTKPKYVAPGLWAKPPPDKNIPLDFVPTKLHAQVRGTRTVKRLPQREAIENAGTDEEKRNAHRLREVVTNSKVNTVYTEEGYEDSAYDHAGRVRDADFHEGFARKLHDRKNDRRDSLSGEKRRNEYRNVVPDDEFEQYDEDYLDHLEKQEETSDDGYNLIGHGEDIWKESETDPKFVAEDGIRTLQEDIEENVVEAERSAKDYQNAQESKMRNDVDTDSSGSEESREQNDLNDEEDEPATKRKISQNEKMDVPGERTRKLRKLDERKKKLRRKNHETTVATLDDGTSSPVDADTPASPRGFATNSASLREYPVDQTTLRYVAPTTATSFQSVDQPTTVSYSQLFWDYFKTKEDSTKATTLVPDSMTTMTTPRVEERTPVVVETIDGHGPYFLVTRDETTTTLPLTFLESPTFHSLFSDGVKFGTGFAHHLPGQNDDGNYIDINNAIAQSTVATFTSVQPLALETLRSSQPEGAELSASSTLLDDIASSSTPAVATLNFTKEAYSRLADYQANPFLGPILDNSDIAIARDKFKYKVLVRPRPKSPVEPVVRKSSTQRALSSFAFQQEDENQKIRDELNAKYAKMLDYLKSKRKIRPLPDDKKIVFPDLTLMRPPALRQIAYPIFPANYPPLAPHSSASIESESPREANWRGAFSRDQDRSQPNAVETAPFRIPFEPFVAVQPVRLSYRKNLLPATKLLPPLPIARVNYRSNGQNDDYSSYVDDRRQKQRKEQQQQQQQQQQHDNTSKYSSLVPGVTRRATRSRRKRSNDDEPREDISDVKAAANNGAINDGESREQRVELTSNGTTGTTEVRNGESVTFAALTNKNSNATADDGESEYVEARHEDARETANRYLELRRALTLLRSEARQAARTNDTSEEKVARNKKRDVSRDKEQSGENVTNRTNGKNHEELLDESPRISGDFIEKEIAVRFNGETNETLTKNVRKVAVEVPILDYVEELAKDSPVELFTTTNATVNLSKYPFYNDEDVPSASALKYVVDPRTVPRKTSRGMEFYDSRNAYKQCDEVEPDLDRVLPEKEEPDPERGSQEDLPRLRGLGEKLDCYKAKYFDENPLDNPLFSEKLIEGPTPPSELDPTKFASKVLLLPKEKDEYVVHRLSKKPERRNGRRWRNRSPQYQTHESIRVNYGHDPQTGRGKNAYLHTVRGSKPFAEAPKRPIAVRRVNNRRTRLKMSSTTPITPKLYQTASYQNQVYEDVMGNIRNMANAYRVYEMTTELPPVTQAPATASSEAALEVSNVTTNSSSREKTTVLPDVTSDKKLPEIKGLLPPPKYTTPRQATYRKHRPPGQGKGRIPLLRSPNLPRIIAHHHTVKINKRSATEDIAKNSSANTNDEDNEGAFGKSMGVNASGNDTVGESMEETTKKVANFTVIDMEIEESRRIQMRNQHLENNDKKKRRNSTSSDQKDESPQRIVYTIKDRIRYSKPKWDTTRFGKFKANARSTVDKDSRRKEPRYNYFERKKINPNQWNNSTMPPRYNSTASTSDIESASSSAEGGESGTTEIYRLAESVLQQSIYDKKNAPEESESSVIDSKSNERERESKRTTSTYRVYEDIDEDVPATTTKRTNIFNSKEILDLQEYLETDAPGYAETFRDKETMTPSNEYSANTKTEERDGETKDEKAEYPEKLTSPWENEKSSESAEEQLETPAKTESSAQEDSSEEFSSKEEEGSNDDRAFFRYITRDPSWIPESKRKDDSEKATFYHPLPFSRYKSMRKEESDEDDVVSVSEEEEEKDYVFPWHADKEGSKRERLQDHDRFEYPWERRERLAEREQRRKQRRVNRFKKTIFDDDDDDDDEEESKRHEKPVYPWERYNVPSKNHVNTRHDVPPSIQDDDARSSTEQLPLMKFSSKYSSVDKSTMRPSSAREIGKSIKKFLEEDFNVESGEERSKESIDRSSSSVRRRTSSPFSESGGISRGTLVPENITQPPRKRSGRKRISPQIDKSVSSSSLFNSKQLRSKEIDDKEEEPATEYLKLNKNNSNASESQVETANGKSRTSSPIARHKKRRRRISKNNSTISLDNATAESIAEPIGRRRRKSQASATTSATLSAGNNLETISTFAPIPSRYSKTNDVETNKSSSFGRIFTDKIAGTNNTEVETSTPRVRMVEHRSRVSKEKIVTKTTYPNETKDFDYRKRSVISTRKDPANKLKVKLNRRGNIDRQNANDRNQNVRGKSTKRKDGKRNYDTKLNNEDEIKRLMVLEKPKVKSENNSLKSLGMRKEEIKQINNFSASDGLVSGEGDSGNGDDFGSIITSEIYAVSNLLQNVLPSRRNGRNGANNMTGNESNIAKQNEKEQISNEKEGGREEKQKSLLQTKFIKDPERRLYYYVA